MNCQTCKFQYKSFCAVNPIHCKDKPWESCKDYEYDSEKEIRCGNCVGMHMGTCSLTGANVEAYDKGCWDFMTDEDVEELREGIEAQEQYEYEMMLSEIKVKLSIKDGNLSKLVLLK